MVVAMVTTLDNPWDYFTQFDEWYAFDTSHGYEVLGEPYNTLNYVARIAEEKGLNSTMVPEEYTAVVNEAVDEIVKMNLTGNYRKITKNQTD